MGKTTRWFRKLLGGKETSPSSGGSDGKPPGKKKWSLVKSSKNKDKDKDKERSTHPVQVNERRGYYWEAAATSSNSNTYLDEVDQNKHAIAVAAATAAVAEAAVAAAQAAAAVVRLTSSSGRCNDKSSTSTAYVSEVLLRRRDDWAAVKIQAAFRGYLARRALHALKGLVKLQALVRGHIMRKKTAETMRCMQALVRVQARARAGRSHIPETQQPKNKLSTSLNPGPATPEKYERSIRSNSTRHNRGLILKRNWSGPNSRDGLDFSRAHLGRSHLDCRMDEQWDNHRETQIKTGPTDDEKSDKILEIDPGKPHFDNKRRILLQQSQSLTTLESPSKDSTTAQLSTSSLSSGEVQSVHPRRSPLEIEDEAFSTAESSPHFYSASSRATSTKRGPFTPTSDCSRSFFSVYSDYPNFMANTESSKAKVRSQSAPKQRLEFEKSSSTKRYSVHGFGNARSSAQRALHANFTSKAYPGSGRLDRLGMPIRSETVGYNGLYHTRY